MIIFIENILCLIKSGLIEFNHIIQSFFVLVIPFVIMFSTLFYFVRAWQKYHKMNERALVEKNKVLIQGVHGSGKTYKLLFDDEFAKSYEIFGSETDPANVRSRVYNEEFLEHEFRIKNSDEDKKVKKDIVYISCTGLTIEEIYAQMLQSCFDRGVWGFISKILSNIKSLNILQTTIEFSFSSRWFMYNTDIKYIIVDDIDRIATNNFELDINRLLGILKNLELFYDFTLLYASAWENGEDYMQKEEIKVRKESANDRYRIGGLNFVKIHNYDRIFNEAVTKSNFTRNIIVKIAEDAVKGIISKNICGEFNFYTNSLTKFIMEIEDIDINGRVLKKVLGDFEMEFQKLKSENLTYCKIICYDLGEVVGEYCKRNLEIYINRDVNRARSTIKYIVNLKINEIRREVMKKILDNRKFGDYFPEDTEDKDYEDIAYFEVDDLMEYMKEGSLHDEVREKISNIIATGEEFNFERIVELWKEFKIEYGIMRVSKHGGMTMYSR